MVDAVVVVGNAGAGTKRTIAACARTAATYRGRGARVVYETAFDALMTAIARALIDMPAGCARRRSTSFCVVDGIGQTNR